MQPALARGRLLDLGVDPCGNLPSTEGAQGFQSVLPHLMLFRGLVANSGHPYLSGAGPILLGGVDGKTPSVEFSELEHAAREEWPVMKAALGSQDPYKRIIRCDEVSESCPNCNITCHPAKSEN